MEEEEEDKAGRIADVRISCGKNRRGQTGSRKGEATGKDECVVCLTVDCRSLVPYTLRVLSSSSPPS